MLLNLAILHFRKGSVKIMDMKKLILLLTFSPVFLFAQSAENADKEGVIKTIDLLFDAMRAGDSTMLKSAFGPEARLMTTYKDRNSGEAKVHLSTVQQFANQLVGFVLMLCTGLNMYV